MSSRPQSRERQVLRCADFMLQMSPSHSCCLPTPDPSRPWHSGLQTHLPAFPLGRSFP